MRVGGHTHSIHVPAQQDRLQYDSNDPHSEVQHPGLEVRTAAELMICLARCFLARAAASGNALVLLVRYETIGNAEEDLLAIFGLDLKDDPDFAALHKWWQNASHHCKFTIYTVVTRGGQLTNRVDQQKPVCRPQQLLPLWCLLLAISHVIFG